jgi:hypothetical protein
VCEQKAGEIIDGEAQLVTVPAGLPRRTFILRSDPGIADQNIQPRVVGSNRFGEPPHLGKRGKIGLIEGRLVVPCSLDFLDQDFGPRLVAAMDQDLGA